MFLTSQDKDILCLCLCNQRAVLSLCEPNQPAVSTARAPPVAPGSPAEEWPFCAGLMCKRLTSVAESILVFISPDTCRHKALCLGSGFSVWVVEVGRATDAGATFSISDKWSPYVRKGNESGERAYMPGYIRVEKPLCAFFCFKIQRLWL